MEKKERCRWFLLMLVWLAGCLAAGCNRSETDGEQSGKLTVAATVFPYYDFARAIGGDYVDVTLLLPPGRDSHSFEPTAQDLLLMQEADVLLYNGGEMETWVDQVLEALPREHGFVFQGIEAVSLLEEVHTKSMKEDAEHSHDHDHEESESEEEDHHETEYDEHIWTSLANAQLLVSAVEDVLCEADPKHEAVFRANGAAYREEIAAVEEEIQEIVDQAGVKKLLFADRFPFLYFAEEYGLEYDAAFAGCSGDTEPSARVIASLIEEIEKDGIQAVYHVEMGNTKTAEMIHEATGAEVLELHSCHTITAQQQQDGVTYVDLMRQNEENLRKGLQECY